MNKHGIVIPREHGGWAMVSVPFLIGMLSGSPRWMHLLLFMAWLLLYVSSYPLLQAVRKTSKRPYWLCWGIGYGLAAMLFLLPVIFYMPSLLWLGIPLCLLLGIHLWHAKHKRERALLNDLCAILLFTIGGAAAYLLGGGGWDLKMAGIIGFSFVYFAGTVFFVKSVFRERKNKRWPVYAKWVHILLFAVPLIFGYPWMILGFVFPAWRAFMYAGKAVRPMKVGIIEIIGAVQFFIVTAIFFA